jgi:hypothetical protein
MSKLLNGKPDKVRTYRQKRQQEESSKSLSRSPKCKKSHSPSTPEQNLKPSLRKNYSFLDKLKEQPKKALSKNTRKATKIT